MRIRGTIWIEATSIGLIGLILGNVIGDINLYYEHGIIGHDLAGFTMTYLFRVNVVAMLLPIILWRRHSAGGECGPRLSDRGIGK